MGSLRLGVKGEVGVGREETVSGKGWVAKRHWFLFTWNRPLNILEEGNGIRFPIVLPERIVSQDPRKSLEVKY